MTTPTVKRTFGQGKHLEQNIRQKVWRVINGLQVQENQAKPMLMMPEETSQLQQTAMETPFSTTSTS